MRAITVSNLKGGVGKTTLVTNLGVALAQKGYRVLLVDTDTQGHVSVSLGLRHRGGLWELMVKGDKPKNVIAEATKFLHVIPSDKRTAAIEQLLVSARDRQFVLTKRLGKLKNYDYVLVDTGPSLSLLLQNAIFYTSNILIPVAMDYFAVLGATQSLDLLQMLGREMGLKYKLLGVIPTFVDKRVAITRTILAHIDLVFRARGTQVFSPMRIDSNFRKASIRHKSILEYNGRSRGAQDLMRLVGEVESCFR